MDETFTNPGSPSIFVFIFRKTRGMLWWERKKNGRVVLRSQYHLPGADTSCRQRASHSQHARCRGGAVHPNEAECGGGQLIARSAEKRGLT